jgi:hypothetical protein
MYNDIILAATELDLQSVLLYFCIAIPLSGAIVGAAILLGQSYKE